MHVHGEDDMISWMRCLISFRFAGKKRQCLYCIFRFLWLDSKSVPAFYDGVEWENYIYISNLVEIKKNHGCKLADLGDGRRVIA